MKIKSKPQNQNPRPSLAGTGGRRTRSEDGVATLIYISLLAVMVILVTVENSSLIRLHREVKLLEQQQLKRLNGPQTNSIPMANRP
jgi:hypothetical protein